MENYSTEGSSKKEVSLQLSPTTTKASSTLVTDENAPQLQTSINTLQWWRQRRQQQPDQQHIEATSTSIPRRSGHPPTTVEEAVEALVSATIYASFAALCGAYSTKCWGYKADFAFAEASGAIAIAMATAAYTAADTYYMKLTINDRLDPLIAAADAAAMSAEAAHAAARARGTTMSLSLTSIVGLFAWPFRSPLESVLPFCSINCLVTSITDVAIKSAAAAHSAVEAAVTTNKITTATVTGFQSPYDVEDATRLYVASRLAQASASAASAAASAVRATHPTLSIRAAHAASTAVEASLNATTTRLTLLEALTQMQDPLLPRFRRQVMCKWLAKLESFRSKTAQFEFEACARACTETQNVVQAANATSRVIEYKIQYGEMTVATAGSACALDISDESSSITIGASTPSAYDEDIDNSSNDI